MAVIQMTDDRFDEVVLKSELPVMVDFGGGFRAFLDVAFHGDHLASILLGDLLDHRFNLLAGATPSSAKIHHHWKF